MHLDLFENGIEAEKFALLCEGDVRFKFCSKKVTGISIDSRSIEDGDVFFAIRGENFDGHDYVMSAYEKGAACVVADHMVNIQIPQIIVHDTRVALGCFAKNYKRLLHPMTVAVTGSVGKTTTRQYIYSVLSTRFQTQKTEGNLNNEIGLPLTLASLQPTTQTIVLEMGMSGKGEISALSKIACPDIAVITNIGTSHIEYLGSRENIRDAKLEIVDGMSMGTILLNGDEPLLYNLKTVKHAMSFYFGIDNPACNYRATNIRFGDGEILFDVICSNGKQLCDLKINGYGKHSVYDALAAVAVGIIMEINDEKIKEGLSNFTPVKMRQNIKKKDGITIIEDCYNASPESMEAALEALNRVATGRKIAVLGDMKELGHYSSRLHYLLGEKAAMSGLNYLITIGSEAQKIAKGAYSGGMPLSCILAIDSADDAENCARIIREIIKKGDTVLIKASRALALERISNLLLTE